MDILFQTHFFKFWSNFHAPSAHSLLFSALVLRHQKFVWTESATKTNSMIEQKNTKTLNNHKQSFNKENESFHQALLLVFTIFS